MTRVPARWRRGAALALVACAAAAPPAAQPLDLGSADDLFERGGGAEIPDGSVLRLAAGPAYLDAWRLGLSAQLDASLGPWSLGLEETLHPAAGGLYAPELDEPYDLARALRYLRFNGGGRPLYARLGPVERVTLGTGALVRGFSTTAAPDEATVGLEAAAQVGGVRLAGFAGDVRLRGVVGAEVEARTRQRLGPLGGLALGASVVHDLDGAGLSGDSSLTGLEVVARAELFDDPAFSVGPYVGVAQILGRGRALSAGLEARAPDLGNAARAHARVGVVVHGADYQTGVVGPLYTVQNERTRIVEADSYYDAVPGVVLSGTPLDSARAGVDIVLDLRVLAFGRAEVMQHLRRHIGPDRGSAYGARLAVRGPRDSRIELAAERQGFRGVFALFRGLGEENRLTLDVGVPIGERLRAFVRSRYGFRRLRDDRPLFDGAPLVGADRTLVERRFEPFVGVRLGGI